MYPAQSITYGSPVRRSSGRLSLLSAAVSAVFALMLSVSGAQGQDLGPFNEIWAREQLIGRWIGEKPKCLYTLLDAFSSNPRDAEIVIRRDGFINGFNNQVKWSLETMTWDGDPRLTLTLWIRSQDSETGKYSWSKCQEGVEVTSKSLRFLGRDGLTYAIMRRAE